MKFGFLEESEKSMVFFFFVFRLAPVVCDKRERKMEMRCDFMLHLPLLRHLFSENSSAALDARSLFHSNFLCLGFLRSRFRLYILADAEHCVRVNASSHVLLTTPKRQTIAQQINAKSVNISTMEKSIAMAASDGNQSHASVHIDNTIGNDEFDGDEQATEMVIDLEKSKQVSDVTNLSAEEEEALLRIESDAVEMNADVEDMNEDALLAGCTDDDSDTKSETVSQAIAGQSANGAEPTKMTENEEKAVAVVHSYFTDVIDGIVESIEPETMNAAQLESNTFVESSVLDATNDISSTDNEFDALHASSSWEETIKLNDETSCFDQSDDVIVLSSQDQSQSILDDTVDNASESVVFNIGDSTVVQLLGHDRTITTEGKSSEAVEDVEMNERASVKTEEVVFVKPMSSTDERFNDETMMDPTILESDLDQTVEQIISDTVDAFESLATINSDVAELMVGNQSIQDPATTLPTHVEQTAESDPHEMSSSFEQNDEFAYSNNETMAAGGHESSMSAAGEQKLMNASVANATVGDMSYIRDFTICDVEEECGPNDEEMMDESESVCDGE